MTGYDVPRRLSALDNAFLGIESKVTPMHVSCLAVYRLESSRGDQPTDLLANALGPAVAATPELRRTLLPGVPRWNRMYWGRPRPVALPHHVYTVRLTGTRDRAELLAVAAELHARRLPSGRPLWEAWVIRGLEWEPSTPGYEHFAVLFKVHHAAVDGLTGMRLFALLHSRVASDRTAQAAAGGQPPNPLWIRGAVRDGFDAVTGPWLSSRRVLRSLRYHRSTPRAAALALPWTDLNGTVSGERAVASVSVSRAEIAQIRKAVPGSTANDVLIAVIGGALRAAGVAADGTTRDLVAGVPISRRRPSEARRGNDFDLLRVPLAVREADPLERLRMVQRASAAGKRADRGTGAGLGDAAEVVPGWLLSAALRAAPAAERLGVPLPVVNTIVSNVAGPRHALYLGPAELVAVHALGPVANALSVFHAVTSYRDSVTLTVTTSPAVLRDVDGYVDLVRNAVADLLARARGDIATSPAGV